MVTSRSRENETKKTVLNNSVFVVADGFKCLGVSFVQ